MTTAIAAHLTWDFDYWRPRVVLRRVFARRWVRWVSIVFALLVIPALIGAVATAQTHSAATGLSGNSGISWTGVKDSQGVPLADYVFSTNHGSLLRPWNTALSMVLVLEFAGFMVIVTTTIWLIGYALSFRWLDLFSNAFSHLGRALTSQIATPLVLAVAATIGAFFVAWFVVRGNPAKAAMQALTMLIVAIAGATILANPLADVLSSNGVLGQGRNVGLAVAAGINGQSSVNPTSMVNQMQGVLATNFARHPVQMWNFNEVVDNRSSACTSAWSSGSLSGDEDTMVGNLTNCGDSSAETVAKNPGAGQIGTGLLLLIFATILLFFGVFLAGKIMLAGFEAVYHALLAIFGFAAGGFIYGPTQNFLIRNLVGSVGAAFALMAYTIYLGAYSLILNDSFTQAPNSGIQMIFVDGVIMIVATRLLKKLDMSMIGGEKNIADRLATMIDGHQVKSEGMGPGSIRHSLSGAQLLGKANSGINKINDSTIAAQIFRTNRPLSPYARRRRNAELAGMDASLLAAKDREGWLDWGRRRADRSGGIDTEWGLISAVDGLGDVNAPASQFIGLLTELGATPEAASMAMRVWAKNKASTSQNPFGYQPLQKTTAAINSAMNAHNRISGLTAKEGRSMTRAEAMELSHFDAYARMAAHNLRTHAPQPNPGYVPDAAGQAFLDRLGAVDPATGQPVWNNYNSVVNHVPTAMWDQADRNVIRKLSTETAYSLASETDKLFAPGGWNTGNRDAVMGLSGRADTMDRVSADLGRSLYGN